MTLSLRTPFGWFLAIMAALAFVYLLGPLVVIIIASFGDTGYLVFPPLGLSLRWYRTALANAQYLSSFATSVRIAGTVTILSCLIGTAAALALTRYSFRGHGFLEALFLAPLILPGLVLAVALSISCLGAVLYNTTLSALALGLLVLSLSRRAPEPD